MKKHIVILGGGTGGTMMANRLRRAYEHDEAEITVVDQDDRHVYQPGLLFVPFGLTDAEEIVRPRATAAAGRDPVPRGGDRPGRARGRPRPSRRRSNAPLRRLVVATGTRLQPEETEGMTGPGWMESVFTFYTPEGATALARALAGVRRGPRRRERRRHADQVPGRPARVLLPRRLVLPRPRRARQGRADLRDAARRGVHEAGRLRASRRAPAREEHRARDATSRRARSTARAAG